MKLGITQPVEFYPEYKWNFFHGYYVLEYVKDISGEVEMANERYNTGWKMGYHPLVGKEGI